MAFRGDMPFGPIMLDLQGFYQSPLYLYIRRRGGHGGFREPVLLAGTPEDIAALEQSFSPEQKTLVEVVDRIDITRQPISDLGGTDASARRFPGDFRRRPHPIK